MNAVAQAAPVTATAPSGAQPTVQRQMVLSVLIFGLPEVRRLKREIETLDEYMRESAIRAAGQPSSLPRLSRLCETLATENYLNLLLPAHRKQLGDFLKLVESTAPSLHISFAADPSSAFTAKVVTWLRSSIHPYALLQVGLQPTIAAGCVVRTNNKVFDFSLREEFEKKQSVLLEALEAEAPTAPVTTPDTPVQPAVAAPTLAAATTPVTAPISVTTATVTARVASPVPQPAVATPVVPTTAPAAPVVVAPAPAAAAPVQPAPVTAPAQPSGPLQLQAVPLPPSSPEVHAG